MNTAMKLAGAAVALLAIAKIVSAKGAGNITATNLTVDKTNCTQSPCTVSGEVTWKNEGMEAAAFTPKLVNGQGEVLAEHPEFNLTPSSTYTMQFSVQITEDTQLCPVPN